MTRNFVAASSQKLAVAAAPLTAVPLTMACWFNPNDALNNYNLIWIGISSGSLNYFRLGLNVSGTAKVAAVTADGSASSTATTSTQFTASAWQHACAVIASATDRRAFLNGAGKGSNATSRTPAGINAMSIGNRNFSVPDLYMDGQIAEAAIWNIALSDAEVALLGQAGGISPLLMHPEALVFYAPLIGQYSPEIDIKGGLSLTVTGATASAHPRVFYPSRGKSRAIPAAGGGGFTSTFASSFTHMGAALAAKQTQATTIASSFGKMGAALNATMQPKGAIASSFTRMAANLAVSQRQTSTIASSFVPMSASLAAKQTQAATIASSFTHLGASLTATMLPRGAISSTFTHMAASLSAKQTQSTSVASAFTHMSASLTAAQVQRATIAATFTHMGAAVSVSEALTGASIASAFPRMAGALAVTQRQTTSIAASFTHVSAALAAKQAQSGAIAASFVHMAAALPVSQRQSSTITATFPHLTGSLAASQSQRTTINAAFQHVTALVVVTDTPSSVPAGAINAAFHVMAAALLVLAIAPPTPATVRIKDRALYTAIIHDAPTAVAKVRDRAAYTVTLKDRRRNG